MSAPDPDPNRNPFLYPFSIPSSSLSLCFPSRSARPLPISFPEPNPNPPLSASLPLCPLCRPRRTCRRRIPTPLPTLTRASSASFRLSTRTFSASRKRLLPRWKHRAGPHSLTTPGTAQTCRARKLRKSCAARRSAPSLCANRRHSLGKNPGERERETASVCVFERYIRRQIDPGEETDKQPDRLIERV